MLPYLRYYKRGSSACCISLEVVHLVAFFLLIKEVFFFSHKRFSVNHCSPWGKTGLSFWAFTTYMYSFTVPSTVLVVGDN